MKQYFTIIYQSTTKIKTNFNFYFFAWLNKLFYLNINTIHKCEAIIDERVALQNIKAHF